MDKKEYFEQLYIHKFDDFDGMDHFVEWHDLSKPTQDEIDNLNMNQ
jgi:hypothetical protein